MSQMGCRQARTVSDELPIVKNSLRGVAGRLEQDSGDLAVITVSDGVLAGKNSVR